MFQAAVSLLLIGCAFGQYPNAAPSFAPAPPPPPPPVGAEISFTPVVQASVIGFSPPGSPGGFPTENYPPPQAAAFAPAPASFAPAPPSFAPAPPSFAPAPPSFAPAPPSFAPAASFVSFAPAGNYPPQQAFAPAPAPAPAPPPPPSDVYGLPSFRK